MDPEGSRDPSRGDRWSCQTMVKARFVDECFEKEVWWVSPLEATAGDHAAFPDG